MDCLLRLASMHRSRNELSTMDLSTMKHETVPFLPPVFDGDVIFELPPCGPSSSASGAKNLEGMDKRYDGHPWCKLVTTLLGSVTNPTLDAKLNSRDQTSSAPTRLQKGRL